MVIVDLGQTALLACLTLVVAHAASKARADLRRELRHAARKWRQTRCRWRRALIVFLTICGACTTVGPSVFYGHELVHRAQAAAPHAA